MITAKWVSVGEVAKSKPEYTINVQIAAIKDVTKRWVESGAKDITIECDDYFIKDGLERFVTSIHADYVPTIVTDVINNDMKLSVSWAGLREQAWSFSNTPLHLRIQGMKDAVKGWVARGATEILVECDDKDIKSEIEGYAMSLGITVDRAVKYEGMDWAEAIVREVMAENDYSLTDEQIRDMSAEVRNSSNAERLYNSVNEFISSNQ